MRIQQSDIKLIQKELKEAGLYSGDIDGLRGPKMDAAVHKALLRRKDRLPDGWQDWSGRRKMVALVQAACDERRIDAGPIDGYYGPTTEYAADLLRVLVKEGALPRPFVDILPISANPNGFPMQNEADITAVYGPRPNVPLTRVRCPWLLTLDWEPFQKTSKIAIHSKLASSLEGILESALDHYGLDGIKEFGLDRYGGSYVDRRIRGGSAWSTHAWGIAVDWYPSRNKLRWRSDLASLSDPALDFWWELWEKEGWLSLGRTEDRDWMHVQAAKR
jgi:hypothetical protein